MKGYTDVPVSIMKEDVLDVNVYVESLSDFILECSTPMTIAIQGDWGSGKTSMMNMIRQNIESKVVPIWFNTWQYSQFDMASYLSISLLGNFLEKIDAGPETKNLLQNVYNGIKFIAKTATVAATEQFAGKRAARKIDDELLSEDQLDTAKQLESLRDNIKTSVEKKLKLQNKERVVVFVDDLDRLAPEKAVELLEVLKIFMDVPNCVFILAVDYGVITQGLIKKFGEQVGHSKGKSFFDKIIQLPFTIPIAQYNISAYIQSLLSNININCSDDEIDMYRKVVDFSVGCNPRSLKRIFNSFILLNTVATKKGMFNEVDGIKTKDKQRILFSILCLQMAFQPVYEFMIKNSHKLTAEFLEGIKDTEFLKEIKDADDLFQEIRKVINDKDETYFEKIAGFMDVFYECLQLDDDLDNLSKEELDNLKNILSFSSITSSTPSSTTQEEVSAETKSKQEICLGFWKQFLEQIKSKTSLFQRHAGTTAPSLPAGAGIRGANVQYALVISTRYAVVELWINSETVERGKVFFDELYKYREKIQTDSERECSWEGNNQRKKVVFSKMKVNAFDSNNWQTVNDFLTTEILLMQKVFQPYLEQVARELPKLLENITNSPSEVLVSKDDNTADFETLAEEDDNTAEVFLKRIKNSN